jgi:hypothetical protein
MIFQVLVDNLLHTILEQHLESVVHINPMASANRAKETPEVVGVVVCIVVLAMTAMEVVADPV